MNLKAALLICSLIALIFLTYSLFNLEKLKINVLHPRVIVEALLVLIFLLLAIFIRNRELF